MSKKLPWERFGKNYHSFQKVSWAKKHTRSEVFALLLYDMLGRLKSYFCQHWILAFLRLNW